MKTWANNGRMMLTLRNCTLCLILAFGGWALVGSLWASQSNPQDKHVILVSQLCGVLLHSRDLPSDGGQENNALRAVRLRLFERRDGEDCCNGLRAVAERISGHEGYFSFKKVRDGSYWLVVVVHKREHKMPIRLQQVRDSVPCSDWLYEIKDSGEFILGIHAEIY